MQVEMERVPPSNLRLLLLMGKVKLKVSSLFIDLELKLRSYQGISHQTTLNTIGLGLFRTRTGEQKPSIELFTRRVPIPLSLV